MDIGGSVSIPKVGSDEEFEYRLPNNRPWKETGLYFNRAENNALVARPESAANAGIETGFIDIFLIVAEQGAIKVNEGRKPESVKLVPREKYGLRLQRNTLESLGAIGTKITQPESVIDPQRLVGQRIENARIGKAGVLPDLEIGTREE